MLNAVKSNINLEELNQVKKMVEVSCHSEASSLNAEIKKVASNSRKALGAIHCSW
jgi:hypothetical protein